MNVLKDKNVMNLENKQIMLSFQNFLESQGYPETYVLAVAKAVCL